MAANDVGVSAVPRDNVELVDLEEIVRHWAWENWEYTKSKDERKLTKEFLHLTINWSHVKWHFGAPKYSMITPVPKQDSSGWHHTGQLQPQILFKTYFTNHTNQEQEYSFKTERITRSSCAIVFEKSISAGTEFALKLKTPCEVAEANVGFKSEMTVAQCVEDTVEEELVWGVDSVVKVPPKTETTAELVVSEGQCGGSFTMDIRFTGRVLVSLTNMKDNNSLITVFEGDMAEIVLKQIERGKMKGFRIDRGRIVVSEIKGKCKFKFGMEQRVRITEQPIRL